MPEKEIHFREFQKALQRATESMNEYYFRIGMADLEEYRYRERVYCYELYHQLRLALECFPYTLQGEMDKGGHPIIHPEIGPVKPDFILHEPKAIDANLVVMEVKPLNNSKERGLKKDLKSLTGFLDLGYYRAIHLIYGSLGRGNGGISKVINAYREYNGDSDRLNAYHGKLLLYWHKAYGEAAIIYDWERGVFNSNDK